MKDFADFAGFTPAACPYRGNRPIGPTIPAVSNKDSRRLTCANTDGLNGQFARTSLQSAHRSQKHHLNR